MKVQNNSVKKAIRRVEMGGWVKLKETSKGPVYTNGKKKITLNRYLYWDKDKINSVESMIKMYNQQAYMDDVYHY